MDIESNQSTDEFDEFQKAGEVEVGKPAGEAGEKEEKPAAKRGPPKEAKEEKPAAAKPAASADEGDDGDEGDEGDDGDEGDEGDGDEKPPKKSAKDHQIERLKREKAEINRQLREARAAGGNPDLVRRLENVEKGLSGGNGADNQNAGKPAPDPTDSAKYPLGHLDDRYVEDKIEWLANRAAATQADTVLQRQQEIERTEAAARQQADILSKVDDLSTKGSELFEDFQESVVESGMRGDWKLSQPTFEAAHEAEHGAQILYDLSQDKKEAARVAALSPYQQLKFVQERDAELGAGKKPRTKPGATPPAKNTARGANSRTEINPATENLDDFEKAWERDAKKGR